MFKKIFGIATMLCIGLGATLSLGSCKKNNDPIEIKSFTSDKSYYTQNEEIIFDIGITVGSKYEISNVTAEIEPNASDAFTIDLITDDGYHYTGKKSYDGTSVKYTLKTIGYTCVQNDEVTTNSTEVRGFSINILVSESDTSNITLSRMIISNPEENEEFYMGQSIKLKLEVDNPKNIKITDFIFTYSNEVSGTDTITKTNMNFDDLKNFSFEIVLPEDALGVGTLKLTKVKYLNPRNLKEVVCELSDKKTCSYEFNLKNREITLESIKLNINSLTNGLTKYATMNGIYTVEKTSILPLTLEIYNPSNATIKKIKINETIYKPDSFVHNKANNITTVKIKVSPPSTTETLDLIDIKIDQIEFTLGQLSINYTPSSSKKIKLYTVNNIIESKDDLKELFSKETITGYNLVTKTIDMQNESLHTSSLKGTLDFNGKLISNYIAKKPFFDTIEETGVLKNINLQNATISTENDVANYYSGLIAETNNGLINNIKISQLQFIANSEHYHLINGKKEYTEIGLVKINSSTGIIKNLDIILDLYSTGTSLMFYDYSPIFVENYGKIACVYTYITSLSTPGTLSTGFYLSGRYNEGSLTGLIYDINCSEEQIATTYLYAQPKIGIASENIVLSEHVLNMYKQFFDNDEWINKTNPYNNLLENDSNGKTKYVSSVILSGGANSVEQYQFFSSLGFEQSGNGFVWVYGAKTGKPYLIYKE